MKKKKHTVAPSRGTLWLCHREASGITIKQFLLLFKDS